MSNPISKEMERRKRKEESAYLREMKEKYSSKKKEDVYCKRKQFCQLRGKIIIQLIRGKLSEWEKFCFFGDFCYI